MTVAEHADPAQRFGEAWERLFDPPMAHRGLWTRDGAPENSLAAFQAACAHGYSIELDVQLSSDGEAFVIHHARLEAMTRIDSCLATRLERTTGVEGGIADHPAADLDKLRLLGGDEPIPTLFDVLPEVGHR